MIRTLLVVAPYYPPHAGGLERYAEEVAARIAVKGEYRVIVLTTSEDGGEHTETLRGVTVRRIPYAFKISNTPFSFRWFVSLFRILREIAPDLIHIHTPVPGLGDLVALIADMKIPLVVTYHAQSMRKGVWYLDVPVWLYEHTLMRVLLWLADEVVCSSNAVRKEFLPFVLHKSSVVTPAVDGDLFSPDTDVHTDRDTLTLLAVNGLRRGEEHKGVRRLIDMLPALLQTHPKVRLVIVGDGSERVGFEALANERGVTSAISFVGAQDPVGMVAWYRRADIFLLPTTNDSFPTVILEAMACGVPVVSTTVGDIRDMIEEGESGYAVDPWDPYAFLDRVRTLCDDPALRRRMGARGRELVVAQHSWERVADACHACYERVSARAPTIVHCAAYYPPHMGGMETVVERMAQESADRGRRVRVYTSRAGAERAPRVVRGNGMVLRRLPHIELAHTPIMWSLPFHLLFLPRGSILHVHVAQALLPEIARSIAFVRGFPFIAHLHLDVEASGPLGRFLPHYKRYLLGPVLRTSDAVCVFSEEQRGVVKERYGVENERIHIVPNGVDPVFFAEPRIASRTPLTIVFVGRLAIQKRVDRLIRAAALVPIPMKVVIVGDGDLRAELETLARSLCPGIVEFVGARSSKGVRKYLRQADVLVLPSDREGMPLTILEAMAAGVPVVGSDVTGIREHVRGVGVLVSELDPDHFAEAIERLVGDHQAYARASRAGVEYAREHTWVRTVDRMEEVYRSALRHRNTTV